MQYPATRLRIHATTRSAQNSAETAHAIVSLLEVPSVFFAEEGVEVELDTPCGLLSLDTHTACTVSFTPARLGSCGPLANSIAAWINPMNIGAGRRGRLVSSGWACVPMK